MNRFAATAGGVSNTASTEPLLLGNDGTAPSVRAMMYDLVVSSPTSPVDQTTSFEVARYTTAPSGGSAVVETPLDTGSSSPVIVALEGAAAVTSTASMLVFSVNQRATFRWVAAPNAGLHIEGATNRGVYMTILSATGAYTLDVTMHWME